MASPLGHSLAAVTLYSILYPKREFPSFSQGNFFLLFILLPNLADIDFLAGFLIYKDFHRIHGMITHSPFFVLLIAFALALIYRVKGSLGKSCWLYMMLLGSHPLIDYFTSPHGLGFRRGTGIALLYPFSNAKFSALLSLFYGPRHGTREQLLSIENLWVVVYEILIFLPVLVLVTFLKNRIKNFDANEESKKHHQRL